MVTVLVMSALGWISLAGIWIAPAFWRAPVAARDGHGYFIFSLFPSPAALPVAHVVHDRFAMA